jgi:hypothetical protein
MRDAGKGSSFVSVFLSFGHIGSLESLSRNYLKSAILKHPLNNPHKEFLFIDQYLSPQANNCPALGEAVMSLVENVMPQTAGREGGVLFGKLFYG